MTTLLKDAIKSKLENSLNCAIAWDGYYDGTFPEKYYDEQVASNTAEPVSKIKQSLPAKHALGATDHFTKAREQINTIDGILEKTSYEIYERARNSNISDINQLLPAFFTAAANRIIRDNKKELVIITPDWWWPTQS